MSQTQPKPERRDLAAEKKSVLAELLVKRHQDQAGFGRAHFAAYLLGQKFAFFDGLKIIKTGTHFEVVRFGDGVTITDFDNARPAGCRR